MKTCGEIVKELRARCKLSRKEFANQLGLKSSNAICMNEINVTGFKTEGKMVRKLICWFTGHNLDYTRDMWINGRKVGYWCKRCKEYTI